MIQIVDPTVQRARTGKPPRDLTMRDIITVPVTYQRGNWNLGDMLNADSIGALFTAYNRAEERLARKRAAKRSPAAQH